MADLLPRQFRFAPNFTPLAGATLIPSRVLSMIRLRSRSARSPIIIHMARPVDVSVSNRLGKAAEFHPSLFQVVEKDDQGQAGRASRR